MFEKRHEKIRDRLHQGEVIQSNLKFSTLSLKYDKNNNEYVMTMDGEEHLFYDFEDAIHAYETSEHLIKFMESQED